MYESISHAGNPGLVCRSMSLVFTRYLLKGKKAKKQKKRKHQYYGKTIADYNQNVCVCITSNTAVQLLQ